MRLTALAVLALPVAIFAADPKPVKEKPLADEQRPEAWLRATERLRHFPRPGEIVNAGIFAHIGDVVETTPEQKAAIVDAIKSYDAALLKKAEAWENDMKALRAEYEAKVIAALPDARRDAAKKTLEYSHAQWTPTLEFEMDLKTKFAQKRNAADAPNVPPEEAEAARKELRAFIKTERQKRVDKDAETTKTLKGMLDAKEVERLSSFDKNREVPVPPQPPTVPKK